MASHTFDTNGDELSTCEDNIPEPFEITYATQKDWRIGEVISFYIGGVGTGLYILSQFMEFMTGLVIGYILVAFGKNLAHLFCASKPLNAFRAFSRPSTSWISRGAYCLTFFMVLGAVDITSRAALIPGANTLFGKIYSISAFMAACVIMIYPGLLLTKSRGIPLWNSPVIPITFVSYSLVLGLSVMAILSPITKPDTGLSQLLPLLFVTLAATILFILSHLVVMKSSTQTARESVKRLIKGEQKRIFVGGVLFMGLGIPLTITGYLHFMGITGEPAVFIAGAMALCGGYLFEASLFKAALFIPISYKE